ncbi:MAG TPA: DUF899 family protein [Fimbriimonadaceae bacterium]|nr:DUF899 family protein [Fimbriimonadaceae bacterium]
MSEVQQLEEQLKEVKARLVEARKREHHKPIRDYPLRGVGGESVMLSELFGDKDDLLVVHNMGRGCDYCTLWADGFNGFHGHLQSRAGFALISNDEPSTAGEFARSRGWKFRVLSGRDSDFTKEMGYLDADGDPWPGLTAFHRQPDGTLYRIATAALGEGDEYCSIWDMFDLLQDGWNGWEPRLCYDREMSSTG